MIKISHKVSKINTIIILSARTSFLNAFLTTFLIITNSKTNLILEARIRIIDFFFLMIISIIRIIIIINNNNNNNSNHKLFKDNNVHYLKIVNLYKSLAKTQTSFLSKINLVNKM